MNVVREISKINERELDLGLSGASWHDEYKDSAYIFAGGLPFDLTEGDVITIFSQYGEVMDINMPRDKETGKSKGFTFLMYEDQRSTILAVDNLNGATVLNRTLRVDHVKNYKQKRTKGEGGEWEEPEEQSLNARPEILIDEAASDSSAESAPDIDPDDPMRDYLLQKWREERQAKKAKRGKSKGKHKDETPEERRARKERKKLKKARKAAGKSEGLKGVEALLQSLDERIPAVYVSDAGIKYGDAHSSSTRSFTPIKAVGDGSFGTVWLCDWHGALPPNTPLSAMQSGAGARPEYANKRLVAVKRMKKKWEGGWDECRRLKELEALRAIPMHPNIIPLYDSFLLPESKELYFVFEPMEGHLFQLIKARKGRPLAGGLVAAIFRQIVHGLHHIHLSGYFHRDMKPENVLVTTTGLHDYPNLSPLAPPDAAPEKDVVVIIKLADFGLARETRSKPPYTEYVSTRWYRAPEVLLKSKDYSNPVDMWALGTIMAELVNLRPLFPGKVELDQIIKITEVLGDPSDEYGVDARGKAVGGGKWSKGIKMAKNVGFTFPKMQPRNFTSLFDRNVPPRLIECIADLLKYDPAARLTSRQCVEHPYLLETSARVNPPHPPLTISTSAPLLSAHRNGVSTSGSSLAAQSPRALPPSHSHSPLPSHHRLQLNHIPDASVSHRQAFYSPSPGPSTTSEYASDPQYSRVRRLSDQMHPHHFPPQLQHSNTVSSVSSYDASPQTQSEWESMVISPHSEIHEEYIPMDIQTSPMVQEYPSRPPIEPDPMQETTNVAVHEAAAGTKLGKLTSLGFRRQHKWGGLFGHGDKHAAQQQQAHGQNGLPPVDEMQVTSSNSTPSLKRTQSSSTDSRSLPEVSPSAAQPQQPPVQQHQHPPPPITDPKKMRKEAERLQREAEMQRRAQAKKSHREQARAVMEKRNHVLMQA
ncbi:hypothetical protein EWM64_g9595, partial [Hericium alpestre]